MANATPSRFGEINSAGDPLALFLKLYAGETLAAFWATTVAMSRHIVRSISGGKSA